MRRQFSNSNVPATVTEAMKVLDSHLKELPSLDLETARVELNLKKGATTQEIRTAYEKHSRL